MARGGEQLAKLKRNYAKAVELLVELASLQVDGRKKWLGSGEESLVSPCSEIKSNISVLVAEYFQL